MRFDPGYYPFPSRRNVLYAKNGCVTTSHPIAAGIGLNVLQRGGNAVDAAIATAVALAVLEPTSNGIGSDCFALVHDGVKLHGLNASGWSPRALTPEAIRERGFSKIPRYGWEAVTVPGAPAGWECLREKFGTLDAEALLAPLCEALIEGVPVPPTIARNWEKAFELYRREAFQSSILSNSHTDFPASVSRAELFGPWFDTFTHGGRTPAAGDLWTSPDQLKTLGTFRREGFRSLYEGSLAESLLDYSRQTGGYFETDDLALYQPEWVEPVSWHYRDIEVWELPPNGQGIAVLIALGILTGDSFHYFGDPFDMHRAIEAMKIALADVQAHVTDPRDMRIDPHKLLEPGYLKERRTQIGNIAIDPQPCRPIAGGTVYLAVADRNGMMVSFIQSNYMGFGSGLVVPGWGISLQNRGCNFTLTEGHPNCLAGRKRPYHTIIPGFLTQNGQALGPFGVMGGFMQPQGHLQVVMNLIDYGLNPQAALDAPRWQWTEGKRILLEPGFKAETLSALANQGHLVAIEDDPTPFGRGQIILRKEEGVYMVGTEKRCDGYAAIY